METVEEVRARFARPHRVSQLNFAIYEMDHRRRLAIRSGSGAVAPQPVLQAAAQPRSDASKSSGSGSGYGTAMYNTARPVQALANMESMTAEAVFILKDFHRHMESPVVVRRLRDVGQKFSANRRTLILTAPAIEMPPEFASLVEFLDLPLPDKDRLREIIRETYTRLAGNHTLKLQLDANGVDAMANNLRGLTEETAERAISQTVIGRQALCPECVTDVLDAKKALLKRSEMLDFVDSTDNMSSVGGLDNLKDWLQQRQGAWETDAPPSAWNHLRASSFWECKDAVKASAPAPLPENGNCRW